MNINSSLTRTIFTAATFLFAAGNGVTAQNMTRDSTALNLKKYQYLSVVIPETKPDGDDARKAYYQQAFPLAAQFGLKQEAALRADQAIISNYAPSGVIFFSYPNQASEVALSNHPRWPAIKEQRPYAWKELRVYSAEIEEDINIQFDPDKSYTLVIAWVNPENPTDYETYLDSIEPMLGGVGGRFIYKMKKPKFEAHASVLGAPAQLTFVEWDTLEGFAALRRNKEYQAANHYIASGTSTIEFYRLSVAGT